MKAFVIDINRCNGCFNCQIVCKDEHCGNDWTPYAKPQPETGQFWMKVNELVRGQVPLVKLAYTPVLCAHCADAPCADACPAGAYTRRDDGLLLIDPDACTGCMSCVDACPAGAIFFNAELGIAQKCTGCAHLLDDGWTVPRCVDACATDALKFGEEEELAELIAKAEPLPALADTGAKVYYIGLPKRFVGACVVDFDADEVVLNATVTVCDAAGNQVAEGVTDYMGDFFFDGLEPGTYTVTIQAVGYESKTIVANLTTCDLRLKDIGLLKD